MSNRVRLILPALAAGIFALLALTSRAVLAADEIRPPSADAIVAGQWELIYNQSTMGGGTIGGHYVQIYSDRRLHWSDTTRDLRSITRPGSSALTLGQPRCSDTAEAPAADMDALRDVVRAIYTLQLPDQSTGIGSAFLQLTITRDGRNYVAGIVHYQPSLENLDPRLQRANTVFGRYSCASAPPTPEPPLRG